MILLIVIYETISTLSRCFFFLMSQYSIEKTANDNYHLCHFPVDFPIQNRHMRS